MGPAVGIALAVASVSLLQAALFLVTVMPLASFARVEITKATLGFGPRLFALGAGQAIEVRLLPFTSSVGFVGGNPYAEEAPPALPRLPWLDAPVWRRVIALVLAPRFVAVIVPLLVLGPGRTVQAILRGFPEVVSAFGGGRPLLDRGAQVLASEGWLVLFALAICKVTAFAILFLPFDLLHGISTRAMESSQKTIAKIRAVVMFGPIVLIIAWLVTWARWAL